MHSASRWVPVHIDLLQHPKMDDLMEALNIDRDSALLRLVRLWLFTAQYAADGDLSTFQNKQLARAMGWDADADNLVGALIETRWLDEVEEEGEKRLVVHDWELYAGRTDEAKRKDAERKRLARERRSPETAADVQGRPRTSKDVHGHPQISEPRIDKNREDKEREGEKKEKRADALTPDAHAPIPSSPPETAVPSEAEQLATLFRDGLAALKPDMKLPADLTRWTKAADAILRIDGRSYERAAHVVRYLTGQESGGDDWWVGRILSMDKLREKFDPIELAMSRQKRGGQHGQNGRPFGALSALPKAAGSFEERYAHAIVKLPEDDAAYEEYWKSVGGRPE